MRETLRSQLRNRLRERWQERGTPLVEYPNSGDALPAQGCVRLERALEDGFVGVSALESSSRPSVRLENRASCAVRVAAGALFDGDDRRFASSDSFLVPPRTTVLLSGEALREVQRVRPPGATQARAS